MKRRIVTAGVLSLLGGSFAFAQNTATATKTNRVSLFAVALRCEAAPGIGCGSRSSPVLLELEGEPIITEAWLNGTGTVLAVVGVEGSTARSRAKIVETILEKNGVTGSELEGGARDSQIESLRSGKNWYRGAEVDSLSKQEAATIAARLVHRVQAKVSLAQENAKALEVSVANAFERRFIGTSNTLDPTCKRERLLEELSTIARENLDENGIVAFQEAVAKGIRPQPDDKEETKTEVTPPGCCSLKSSAQN
jgi:hypothetical protein